MKDQQIRCVFSTVDNPIKKYYRKKDLVSSKFLAYLTTLLVLVEILIKVAGNQRI